MSELDKAEYARLEDQVEAVEKAVAAGRHNGAEALLGRFLENAKLRMATLRESGTVFGESDKERRQARDVAVLHLVARESNLSAVEKEQYANFLEKEFFTKSDFSELESFYSSAWDRLSEGGKEQMSHRVWEGIRQGEYRFDELPEVVRRKESDRLYEQMKEVSLVHGSLSAIPKQDREDFIRAYEAGDEKTVAEALSRDGFALNTTYSKSEDSLRDPSVSSKKEGESKKLSDSSVKEANDASEDLSTAGIVLAEAGEVEQPLVDRSGFENPVQRG